MLKGVKRYNQITTKFGSTFSKGGKGGKFIRGYPKFQDIWFQLCLSIHWQ
jgi:hypothetical protein